MTCMKNINQVRPFAVKLPLVEVSEYSRYNLSVVDEIFQWVTAREVVVEICGVTDDALWGAGRINVSCDNDGLNAGEHAEWTRGAGHLIHNLKMSKMKFNKVLYKNAIHLKLFYYFYIFKIHFLWLFSTLYCLKKNMYVF